MFKLPEGEIPYRPELVDQTIGLLVDSDHYWAPVVSRTQFIVDAEHTKTASIMWMRDRLEIRVNPRFLYGLSVAQRKGLIKHEFLHFRLRHLYGSRSLKMLGLATALWPKLSTRSLHYLVNVAEDLEINGNIIPEKELPETLLFYSKEELPPNLIAEEYLRLLKDKITEVEVTGMIWGQGDILEGELMDEVDEERLQELWKECDARGNAPANLARLLEMLNLPQLKWPKDLYSSVNSYMRSKSTIPSWAKENRRGLPVPGRVFKEKPDCYVFQDTSGSMSEKELALCASEIFGLRKYFNNIHVLVIDAAVHYRYIFKGEIEKVIGGGGSDFTPAFEEILNENPRDPVFILLTDGDISVPEEYNGRVWWVLTKDREVPYGTKIVLDGRI